MLKSFLSDIWLSEPKIRFFFDYRLSPDARNWFRQASSTDDESGCASSMRWCFVGGPICSSASWFFLAVSAAAVVHSSNSHFLVHTSFGSPNSRPGIVDQRLLQRHTGAHQLRQDKADIKRHPASICLLHSLSQITADYYYTRYRRRHANPYIIFADTSVQRMNTHQCTISVCLYKLVQLHSTVLETIFDFCKSKTRTIKNFDNQIFEKRLSTLVSHHQSENWHTCLVIKFTYNCQVSLN